MNIGQKVYTVNAETNTVDTWTYNGTIRTSDGILIHLTNGKKYCFLPARCVFEHEADALRVVHGLNE